MPSSVYTEQTPEAIKASPGFHLLTMGTSNGQRTQIMLEELKDAYNFTWQTTIIDIVHEKKHKEPWYLRLHPDGRIPVLLDNTRSPPFPIIESNAQMAYLQERVDTAHRFGFADALERSQAQQWMSFGHDAATVFVQLVYWTRRATGEHQGNRAAIQHYTAALLRAFRTLDAHLAGTYTGEPREFLAGTGTGKYALADMTVYPAYGNRAFAGLTDGDVAPLEALRAWAERVGERDAVKRALGEAYLPAGLRRPQE